MNLRKALLTPALLIAALSLAQGPSAVLTPEVKAQTVRELAKDLREEYLDLEIGKKAADAIESHLKANDYDSISDGQAFADRLNKDLSEFCKDKHFDVVYSKPVWTYVNDVRHQPAAQIENDRMWTQYNNGGLNKVERLKGNIGYISIWAFLKEDSAKLPIKAAMEFLSNTNALIVDVRDNGGGDPATVRRLCSYLFDGKPVHLENFVGGGHYQEFWTLKRVDGPRFAGKDVYVLVDKLTCSAAEALSYDLQALKRATVVGETTWGGASVSELDQLSDHFLVSMPIARSKNAITHTNWEGTGVKPDIAVDPKDSLNVAYTMALKKEIERTSDPDMKKLLQQILKDQEAKGAGSP
ncbi:MAG TPA: S41 family peptidase [Fimbriimonadaceae bacterium]|nr:S41 family peptidase [Fimbriimonadaceae bacterium]